MDGLQALTEHYKHLREDDKEKIGNLSEELKKKDNVGLRVPIMGVLFHTGYQLSFFPKFNLQRITDLQRQLAQMTGEAKKSVGPLYTH